MTKALGCGWEYEASNLIFNMSSTWSHIMILTKKKNIAINLEKKFNWTLESKAFNYIVKISKF
jgi:hypothetical protein